MSSMPFAIKQIFPEQIFPKDQDWQQLCEAMRANQ
jgi:hypothetical protein